jgi:sterol desaturase/sphingolipid hydroxylase (fatty acid hydroxylase superfamily)
MTFWTDDRNHILDETIAALWFGTIALLIGVSPAQFPLLLLLMRLVEAFSHGNIRLSFGRIGERLLVSPRFHRLHHGVLSVAEHGKNYAVLFPVWDWLFKTADFNRHAYPRTGDPDAPELVAASLRTALDRLGEVARAIPPDDVLGRLFAGFCIGK